MASWRPFLVSMALVALPGLLAIARAQDALPPHPHPSVTPPPVSLLPGKLLGHRISYRVKPGDTIYQLAVSHAIHPVRILKPNARELAHGLQRGHLIMIDERRIQPSFPAGLSGIVLNVPEAEAYWLQGGRLLKSYPVGVSMSNWEVPLIQTHVVDMEENPDWVVPQSIQKVMQEKGETVKARVEAGPDNPLGVRWIGFADGTYGLHGTNDPGSIKHYDSHGCVHFRKDDIIDLYKRVKLGTPVTVDYQPVLMAIRPTHIWLSVYPDIYKLGYDFKAAVKTLAAHAGVTRRLHWDAIDKAIQDQDGMVVEVSKALVKPVAKKPGPRAAQASPRPQAPLPPSPSPLAPLPSVAPSSASSAAPSPAMSASAELKVP